MKLKNVIYMVVTKDKFELPLFVGNIAEIADAVGIKKETVSNYICKKRGKYKIIRVKL